MTPLEITLEAFATQATTREGASELGVIVAGLLLGWLVGDMLRRGLSAKNVWKFGAGGFDRVANPLTALAIIWCLRLLLRKSHATPFVDVTITLLAAFAIIRFAMYVLRHVLPQGALLRGTERAFAILMWLGVALHVTGLLPDVSNALESIAFNVGSQRITLLLVMQGVVSVAITLAISLWLGNLVERQVLATERLALSTRVVVAKLVRALALLLAILVALPIVGIDITALSVFGGALGVGLGFGLQKIASNYVSGFIILLDRSIRIGDFVSVDNRQGVVKAIESRYTVIRSLDGTESIIPNESMITQSVTNHSFTDRQVLIRVPVGVGYASDIDRVFDLLIAAARRQPRVLAEPAPSAWIAALGDNGVEIELGIWIADPEKGTLGLRGAILKDALAAFRGEGIEIPFPQRDVRILSTPQDENT